MPTICIQCSMQALVDGRAIDLRLPPFDGSPEEHRTQVHPDPVKTKRERAVLELARRLKPNENLTLAGTITFTLTAPDNTVAYSHSYSASFSPIRHAFAYFQLT